MNDWRVRRLNVSNIAELMRSGKFIFQRLDVSDALHRLPDGAKTLYIHAAGSFLFSVGILGCSPHPSFVPCEREGSLAWKFDFQAARLTLTLTLSLIIT